MKIIVLLHKSLPIRFESPSSHRHENFTTNSRHLPQRKSNTRQIGEKKNQLTNWKVSNHVTLR